MTEPSAQNEQAPTPIESTESTEPTLWTAAEKGDLGAVKQLLEGGANVDYTNAAGFTPLICASINGQLDVAKYLLDQGAQIDISSPVIPPGGARYAQILHSLLEEADAHVTFDVVDLGITALDGAAESGNVELVRLLLDKGGTSFDLSTNLKPLFMASQKGHLEVVKLLLDRGASVDLLNDGFTSLNVAAMNGHLEIAKLLLDNGANIDLTPIGFSALYFACCNGLFEMAKLLVDRGANIELSSNEEGNTPLQCASVNGHLELVKFLLARGASVDKPEINGRSALIVASVRGYTEVARVLLDHGAKVDMAAHTEGNSSLIRAATHGHVEVMKLLIDRGATIDLRNKTGVTALIRAACNGHLAATTLLLDRGANVNMGTNEGVNALSLASRYGYLEVVKLLVSRGADVNLGDQNNFCPMHEACRNGKLDVVMFLVEQGANLAAETKNANNTPLKEAAAASAFDVLRYMAGLSAKLDVLGCRNSMRTCVKNNKMDICETILKNRPQIVTEEPVALHLAVQSDHPGSFHIMQLLIENGADVNWVDHTTGYYKQTALHIAIRTKQPQKAWQLMLHGADPSLSYKASDSASYNTVWELCEGQEELRTALLHFWTPKTHKQHPQWVKDAIISTLLIAKKQEWPFDKPLFFNILSYVAYGWYKKPITEVTIE